jgi:ABC-type multidrug transport system fused ATPase/permease subunit
LEDALREKIINYTIIEDGINLSIGEKQLMCIARAL